MENIGTALARNYRESMGEGAELALLQWRIRDALAYMNEVVTPNLVTMTHIRRYLRGEYDDTPGMHHEAKPVRSEDSPTGETTR